jgi:hypothetical protein
MKVTWNCPSQSFSLVPPVRVRDTITAISHPDHDQFIFVYTCFYQNDDLRLLWYLA